ncbi:hybrid sensor histidine kinase/response regulator [Defluviimonas salinarum]|uniref:histidine kinase n=1 Tax=Defluviimonas salinarum TaxID=2992147 RepID=A0ABT3J272_9RHOB|nr:PAS-domain containing protein [Defluviimonas salinarum]MCW3781755.1 PAS-domain containing protein [Defluviimonas salinarum]
MERNDTRAKLTQAGLNLIQQALSIYDKDLRLAVCNRRFQEMFDLPEALVTPGAAFEDTIRYLVTRGEYGPVEDEEDAVRTRVEQARAFQPHYMERTRANGRTISVEGSPLQQGGWVTVYTDITEIKAQEALLRTRSEELSDQLLTHAERLAQANRALGATNAALTEAKRELTEMEARTRLVTEMMPAHIAHVGHDLVYTYSNRRLSAVMPGSLSDIVGRPVPEALGAETFAKIEPGLGRALSGEPNVFEFTHDASGRRIRLALTPDRDAGGRVQGVYILSMDVTEETQARAALSQSAKRELAAQLTSGLAHDFANLLTIILGLQGRLERIEKLPADAADLARATLAAARRGGTLLDRIAAISGPREIHPAATDLAALLDELRIMAGPSLPEGIGLDILVAGALGPVLLDAGSLQDSLLNLVLNARDAIGSGVGRITLTVRPVRDTWIEISVADTGPGFSAAALDHGLDPFFTTKGGEGSGLGLSMVYDHTKLMGGSVKLANRPEGGARVMLRLPLRPVGPAPAAPLLVLLVEDTEEIRTDIREMLTAMGHNVIEAASVAEAEELVDLPGVDLVLSDISLPGGRTGVDFMQALAARDHPARRLLMTSLPPGDAMRARAGAVPILSKPFTAAELAAELATREAA